jgi:hypothetical protein
MYTEFQLSKLLDFAARAVTNRHTFSLIDMIITIILFGITALYTVMQYSSSLRFT